MVVAARKCKVAWHSPAWIMCIPIRNAIRRIFIFAESSGDPLNYARMNSLQISLENKLEFQSIPRLNAPFFAMEVRAVVYILYLTYLISIFRNAFTNLLYPYNMNIFFRTYFYIIEKECRMNVLFAMGFICPVLDKCRWLIRHHRYAHIIFPLLENPWKRWCDQARMYDIAEVHTWWWFVDVALLHFHLCRKGRKITRDVVFCRRGW